MALSAVAKLKMAERIFVGNKGNLPVGVLSAVRFSLSRCTLLAGRLQESKAYLEKVMADDGWKHENPREAQQAQDMWNRLNGVREPVGPEGSIPRTHNRSSVR